MHRGNKVKGYFNFHISNLEILKKGSNIFISEQHNERNFYEQY